MGAEVGDTPFCPKCGTELEAEEEPPAEEPTGDDEAEPDRWRAYAPDLCQIGVAGVVTSLITGGFVAWGLANIGGLAVGFLLGRIGVMLFLWQKPTGVGAVGSGLYVCALLLVLVPIFF